MVELIGNKKINLAVFISGKGSNFYALAKSSMLKKSKFKINLVISNNRKAKGLIFAKKFKIKKKILNFKNKNYTENKIIKLLSKDKIDLICLAGFMKILSKNFIKRFKGKIMNIHPSLLPKYKGLNVHERVIKNKEKYSGCTVHFVSSKLDSGKIILQKKVKVLKNDTPKSLAKKILKQEHLIYTKAIEKIYFNL